MNEQLDRRLDDAYTTGDDRNRQNAFYDDWAREYDRDLWASGNPYVAIMAGLVGRHVRASDARILDAGCGTGYLGGILHKCGYTNLVGLDPSDGMRAAAEAKGCYVELHDLLLGEKIDLPDASFDAVTAAGVLTHGHAPAESLDGIVRIARPGAPIIYSISQIAHDEAGFGAKADALEASGAWQMVERTASFQTFPFSERHADLRHWICVYRKTGQA